MNARRLPLGTFQCPVTFETVRPPTLERKEEGGATYITGRGYELQFRTTLRFNSGDELPVTVRLFGEGTQHVVIRDATGKPVQTSGYAQGRSEVADGAGNLIFAGRYYDTLVTQTLAGDDALTPVGPRICDHRVNGFGSGGYLGHHFSLGVRLSREGGAAYFGEAVGQID